MKIPDEMLSAFVNGELDAPERQRIEQAIARDRHIAERVAKKRARRGGLQVALEQRISSRKLTPGSAQIIDLARVRADRARLGRRLRTLRSPRSGLVATLIIGLCVGAFLTYLTTADALTRSQNGALFAHGALNRALNGQITGQPAASSVRIGATYRTRSGNYCRTFNVSGTQSLAGLACRSHGRWQLQVVMSNAAAPALQSELNRIGSGAPLGSAEETQLRARNWQ
jgi:hypothetical protein